MSSNETVISAQGLTKVFKDFWGRPKARAVDGIDFEVRQGEVFGLLGPNGSGKSTIVKMLLGLLYPTRGRITVFDHSPRHVQTKARIGYLPEESYLYRYLNSDETIDFFGSLFHIDSKERRDRADQLIESFPVVSSISTVSPEALFSLLEVAGKRSLTVCPERSSGD